MTKTKKTDNKEILDIQEKQFNRLKRKAELGLTAYDGDDKVYTYVSQADKLKDEMIAVQCINNDKPVPRDVRQRLLAERRASYMAQRAEFECDNKREPWYLKECLPFKKNRAGMK